MRPLAHRSALSLAVVTLALAVPRAAGARVQGTPECPTPVPAPAPDTSYSCNFARMPFYNQSDPNLAFMIIPCDLYGEELVGSNGQNFCNAQTSCPDPWQSCQSNTCTQHACGTPGSVYPYAQSWLPYGPAWGDIGAQGGLFLTVTCSSTAEAMALNAALAYRSSSTAIAGQYCQSSSQCPTGFACAGHTCTPAGASCNSTSYCPTGSTCQSGTCVAAACSSTTPCPSGYTCGSAGVCAPTNATARTINPPTSLPAHPSGTYYTYAFAEGGHREWTWNCTNYTTVGAALTALPRGFLGGCMGGAPNLLWTGSFTAGSSVPTVAGLEQIAHMAALTNLEPDFGYVDNAGSYTWAYGQSFQPFAAELYDNASDGASCQSDADCVSGYCLDPGGGFHAGGPGGTCASAAYQTFDATSSSSYGITTAMLRAAIDRGGVGVLAEVPFLVSISGGQMTFTPTNSHYVAIEGYTASYDQSTNETLTFAFNNPGLGSRENETLVDAANGTYTIGGEQVTVVLPGTSNATGAGNVTNAVIWPVAADGTGRTIHSITDLQDGEQVTIGNTAYFLYVQ